MASLPKEASEVMTDPEGRWFSFCLTGSDLIILEKKGIPAHLASLDNLDKAVTLQSMLMDLQDQGEARLS